MIQDATFSPAIPFPLPHYPFLLFPFPHYPLPPSWLPVGTSRVYSIGGSTALLPPLPRNTPLRLKREMTEMKASVPTTDSDRWIYAVNSSRSPAVDAINYADFPVHQRPSTSCSHVTRPTDLQRPRPSASGGSSPSCHLLNTQQFRIDFWIHKRPLTSYSLRRLTT